MRFINFLKMSSLALMLCLATQLQAADVDVTAAQNAARSFLAGQVVSGRMKAQAMTNLKLVKAEASVAKPTAVDYYIFNAEKSYVVIAGDDQAPEVLMYGDEGALDIDNIPPAMQWLLNKYKYQIDGLKAGTLAPNYYAPRTATAVAPLVTANWDQSAPYYNQTPTNGSRHTLTGCPATSMSMCFYKWKWPKTYPAQAAINGSSSGGVSASALPEREADWDNILAEYTGPTNYSYNTTQANAVAWLMRYCGQACPDYMYGTSASGADDPEILDGFHNMGYVDAQYKLLTELVRSGYSYTNSSQYYTDAQWNNMMLTELYAGRPIEYLAYDITSGQVSGHAFNVFGCNASGQYYVNWGWSGDSNGYCTLHNFTTATGATGQSGSYVFKYGEAMIIGIEPPAGALGPGITVNPSAVSFNGYVGQTYTQTFNVKGSNLTGNITVAKSGSNVYSVSPTTITAAQAMSDNGVDVTVTYAPTATGSTTATLTLSSSGADSKTVTISGTAQAATPTLIVNNASLSFSNEPGHTQTKTISLTGRFVTGNVTVTLNDPNNVFSLSSSAANAPMRQMNMATPGASKMIASVQAAKLNAATAVTRSQAIKRGSFGKKAGAQVATLQKISAAKRGNLSSEVRKMSDGKDAPARAPRTASGSITIPGSSISETTPVTINVAFNAATTGNYNGSITIAAAGAQTITVPLTAVADVRPEYVYVLTNTLTAGKEYLIVNSNATGSRYALGHNGTTVATDGVTVKSDASIADAPYIEADDVDATTVWTTAAGTTFKNGDYYIGLAGNNNNRSLAITTSATNWTYNGNNSRLSATANNRTYYLRYNNNNFSVTTTGSSIYIYEKKAPLSPAPGEPSIVSAVPTATTSEVTWTPGDYNTGWNLRYRPYTEGGSEATSTLWDLPADGYQQQISQFSVYDADGDGDNWTLLYTDDNQTDLCFASFSYDSDTQTDLTPDNYLITPEVTLGGTLKFKACVATTNYPDKIGIYVLPEGDESMYLIQDVSPQSNYPNFVEFEIDLGDYDGTGEIVFRHYNSDGQYAIMVDDIEVITPAGASGPWTYVNDVTSPNTITGLTPETTYEVQVQGYNSDNMSSDWTESTLFTTLSLPGMPTELAVEPGSTTGDATWTAGAGNDTWNLRWRPYVEIEMESILWDFPVGSDGYVVTDGWSHIDNDEDGYDWGLMATDGDDNTDPTDACWYSQSFINDVGAVTPDNWLVSPEVQLGGSIKFTAWRSQYPGEVLGVYVYQDGNEYLTHVGQDIQPTENEVEYEFDLSEFSGTGRVIICHYNCTDGFYVFVDDITITSPTADAGEWNYVYNLDDTQYQITGLTPETTYEVQVQGANTYETSAWTASTIFTTLAESIDLATLVATGVQGQNYNLVDGDIIAVKLGKDGKTLYCKDDGKFASPFGPAEGQTDYVVSCGLMEEYDQSNWVALTITEGEFPASILGHTLSGVKGVYSNAVNPTLTLSALPNYTLQQIATQYDYNIYVPANFMYTTQTTENKEFFFMTPKPMEVLTVFWAMWDGHDFVMPTKSSSSEVTWNEAGLMGVFTPNFDLYEGDVPNLEANVVYTFSGVVKKVVKNNSPERAIDGATTADEYEVYPLNGIEEQGRLEGDIPTSVNDLVVGRNVKSVTYYNVHGQASMTPFSGLNMVEVRYTDGTRRVVKIMK